MAVAALMELTNELSLSATRWKGKTPTPEQAALLSEFWGGRCPCC